MRTATAALLLSFAAASPAMAALSGYWQSSKEIHAILGSNDVADALRQQPVVSIVDIGDGYRLQSRDCVVDVEIDRQEPGQPGALTFRIIVGKASCRNDLQ